MPVSLITGGAGFMGSHVAEHLLKMGHTVVVIDDLSGGFVDNVPDGAVFIEGSILDHEFINCLSEKYSFRYVYHLAAYAPNGGVFTESQPGVNIFSGQPWWTLTSHLGLQILSDADVLQQLRAMRAKQLSSGRSAPRKCMGCDGRIEVLDARPRRSRFVSIRP